MITLKDVRDEIRAQMIQHDMKPLNEQQVRALLQKILVDLQDIEAETPDTKHHDCL